LVDAFNSHNSKKKINASKKIAQYIMDFTSGHLGLIRWMLNGVDNYFSYRDTSCKVTTAKEIMSYFTSSDFMEHIKAHRGAHLYNFNVIEGNFIDELLLKDELPVNSHNPDKAVNALVEAGILSYVDDEGSKFGESRARFLSPAARLLSFFHRSKKPLKDGFTLQELVREALSRINSKALTHNMGRSKDGTRLLERVWQMEFYTAIYSCLPDEMHISSDVGRIFATDGAVDFYISEPQWAIELLIDGIDLKRHHERFQDGGRYSPIPIKSYILLDIRETRIVQKSYPKTWHITPNADFTVFNVLEGTDTFNIFTRRGYPRSPVVRLLAQESEALKYEMSTIKKKHISYCEEGEEIREAKKRQDRRDIV
ncbi:4196_t:CDS:2, partial [Acaulospora morrowiae]